MENSSLPDKKPTAVKINRFQISFNVVLQTLLVIFIIGAINYFAFNHFKRWDFSRNKMYQLSDQTKHLIKTLKRPLHIYVFFSESGDDKGLIQKASDVLPDLKNLLKEYQFAGRKNIIIETVDPLRNLTKAQALAAKYKFGGNDNIVILDYDGRTKFINASDMADWDDSDVLYGKPPRIVDFKGEEAITSALLELVEHRANTIYYLTGQGELDLESSQLATLKAVIERQNIKLKPLNLANVQTVPQDARALLVIGAQYDFTNRDISILRSYWNKKGRLLLFLSPDSAASPNLDAFLKESGVAPDNDRVLTAHVVGKVSDQKVIAQVISDVYGFFLPDSPITKKLAGVNGLFMGATQSLTLSSAPAPNSAGITVQPLVEATKGYWGVPASDAENNQKTFQFDPQRDKGAPLYLAATVEKGAVADPHVQVDSSRMIVIGNSTCTFSNALSQANADFFLNGVNWLLSRNELIGIPSKIVHKFTLTLDDKQIRHLAIIAMGIIPGIAALIGIAVWWVRRRQPASR